MSIFWLNSDMRLADTWRAICIVESGGKVDAVGDRGAAVGIAQIHKVLVDDVNRIQKREHFIYCDRYSPDASYRMFRIYVLHYYPNGGPEQWSRCWNGGPNGVHKKATVRYWERVSNVMRKLAR